MTVELYNAGVQGPDGGPVLMEKWNIDPVTLKRLKRVDHFGCGYTLALPWGSYRPDVTDVHLRVCYQPRVGTPLYDDTGRLKLGDSGMGSVTSSKYSVSPPTGPVPLVAPPLAQAAGPVSAASWSPPLPQSGAGFIPTH